MAARTLRLHLVRRRTVVPVALLVLLVLAFGAGNNAFFGIDGLSRLVQQSLVVGMLALGQALVVLTAGVDLACAAIAVFGTLLMAKLVMTGTPGPVALGIGVLVATGIGLLAGGLAAGLRLPPFLVTFGMLVIVAAVSDRYARGSTYSVVDPAITWTGTTKYLFGRIELTYGMGVLLAMYLLAWFVLRTRWAADVRTIGVVPRTARRNGIPVRRTTIIVYLAAGLCDGIAAWLALGRVPIADPEALPLGNLDAIAAVAIGGVSLFGGRGGVIGVLAGALIVTVVRTGLGQYGVDTPYQDVVLGVLLIAAVAVDRYFVVRQR